MLVSEKPSVDYIALFYNQNVNIRISNKLTGNTA